VNPTTCAISVAFVQKLSGADTSRRPPGETDTSDTLFFSRPPSKMRFLGALRINGSSLGISHGDRPCNTAYRPRPGGQPKKMCWERQIGFYLNSTCLTLSKKGSIR
jgi:hypothetical protein